MLRGDVAEFTCLAGTMVQEVYRTHPDIRDACDASIGGSAAHVESDIADAMKRYHTPRAMDMPRASRCTRKPCCRAAFILAKAKGNAAVVEASIDHPASLC